MANLNQNGGTGIKTPGGVICDYYKQSKGSEKDFDSIKNAASTTLESYQEIRRYKICCLLKAEANHDYYQDIDNRELALAMKSAESIKSGIEVQTKKNGDLEKMLVDVAKIFGELKTKLHDAYDESCKMSNSFPPNFFEKNANKEDVKNLKKALEDVTIKAKELDADAYKACEDSVTTAGIHTFFIVDSLLGFSQSVLAAMKEFKTSVDDSIKKGTDEVKTAQGDLTKLMEQLNQKEFELNTADAFREAYQDFNVFICTEPTCPPTDSIELICKKLTGDSTTPEKRGRQFPNID